MPVVRKLHEQLMADLLGAIVRGDYEEGARLPKEVELARSHDVSRYVARECIQALRDRGVLSVRHGVGARVAPRHEWSLFDPVLMEAMLAGPEAQQALGQATECLKIVWPEVAALAARRRTAAVLERLAGAGDGNELLGALAEAAGNRFLRQVVVSLDRAPEQAGAALPSGLERYRPVLEAVRSRDAEASRAAMRKVVERRARPPHGSAPD